MSLNDYKGPFRSEIFIADATMVCWNLATLPGSNLVNLNTILDELVAHGVESIFHVPGIMRKGRLKIETIEDDPREFPAYVKYSPTLKLCVQKKIWSRFQEGYSKERIIIAHEIGHVMLHSDDPKQFSRDKSLQINFAENEYSVEWQANTFADHLLIPTHIAERIKDISRVAFACNVPEDFAYERLTAIWRAKKMLGAMPYGKLCPDCGNFSRTDEAGEERCNTFGCFSQKMIKRGYCGN